jgi:ATP-binding cassette subfamily F protein uup
VDRLFCFEGGRLERFEGNYSAYLEKQGRRETTRAAASPAMSANPAAASSPAATPSPEPTASGPPAAAAPRRRSYRESRELEAIERDLPAWEQRRAELEGNLAGAGDLDHGALEERSRELAELIERIAAAEERWLVLSEMAS